MEKPHPLNKQVYITIQATDKPVFVQVYRNKEKLYHIYLDGTYRTMVLYAGDALEFLEVEDGKQEKPVPG